MLTYTYGPSDSQLMAPKPFRAPSKSTTEYNPPIEEFSVLLIDTLSSGKEEHPALEGPSVLIFTELQKSNGSQGQPTKISFRDGEGGEKELDVTREGQTFFIAPSTKVEFKGNFIAYRAYVEVEEEGVDDDDGKDRRT